MAAGTLHFEPLEPRLLLNADLIEPVPLSSLDTYLGGDAIYVDLSRPGEDAGPSFQPSTELVGQEQPIVAAGTSYVVNSLEDVVAWDGKLTLREAIQAANTNAPVGDAPAGHSDDTDVIRFASSLSGGTITLNGSQLSVNGDIQIIDGPAASGKTTLGRRLAEALGYLFFDTGVMYRAVTWAALQRGVPVNDEAAVTALAEKAQIDIHPPSQEDGRGYDVLLDGEDVTWDIRRPQVDANVSPVSVFPGVRRALTIQQRRIGLRGRVVMVGRGAS